MSTTQERARLVQIARDVIWKGHHYDYTQHMKGYRLGQLRVFKVSDDPKEWMMVRRNRGWVQAWDLPGFSAYMNRRDTQHVTFDVYQERFSNKFLARTPKSEITTHCPQNHY